MTTRNRAPRRKLIWPGEAAEQLGVSPRTIRKWISQGRLPVSKLPSGRYKVALEDIERIAETTLVEPEAN